MARARLSEEARLFFRRAGARGGTIGSAGLTPAQRKARATKASRAAAAARTAAAKARRRGEDR
jgi:hypothetical protein